MWLQLIITLPTENATVRQRAWRALKSSGAAVLRDGVYLMPDSPAFRATFDDIVTDVRAGNGTAWVLLVQQPDQESEQDEFKKLFDRSADYAPLLEHINATTASLSATTPDVAREALKQVRKFHKAHSALAQIDFFPGAAKEQTLAALQALERTAARIAYPDEPQALAGAIAPQRKDEFRGRIWATRKRPWIDRLASAWLIRRFIDPSARFVWLEQPADCPFDAVGFDFDGAPFTHVGDRVTFEVLMATFDLEQPALLRLGALVHYLDVGGVQPVEAAGVESVLAGMKARIADDDVLLASSNAIFDALHETLERAGSQP